jgi:hypothetical protein
MLTSQTVELALREAVPEDIFGKQFTYVNENGSPFVGTAVLAAFRNIAKDYVVWEPEDRYWRKRKPSDKAGGKQD